MDGALKQLADIFDPQTKEILAAELGSEAAASLPQLCPVLIAQLYKYLNSSNCSEEFLRQLHNTPEFSVNDLSAILTGGLPQLLPEVLNNHISETIEAISASLNINKENAISLLSVAGSIVLGIAGNYLRNRTEESISLVGWLESHLPELRAAAPSTLGQGNAAPANADATADSAPAAQSTAHAPTPEPAPKRAKRWPWILLIALLLLAFLLLRSCKSDAPVTEAPAPAVSASQDKALEESTWSMSTRELGAFFKKELPGNVTLNIPENGIENRLIAHIESGDPVSKTLWFSFDRLVFKTNSADLEAQSEEQLDNIASILRAWNKVNIKLGGYTDNTGTEALNMKLSQQRADTVRLSLIERGVSPERITAEGYGSAHPVVPNDSAENRARNRRIDINVVKK